MKRLICLILALGFSFSVVIAQIEVDPEKKLEDIQTALKKSKQQLLRTKEEEQAVLGRLAGIRKELHATNKTLNQANKKIKVNEVQVGVLRTEVRQTSGFLGSEEDKLGARLREIYKGSKINYLEILFSSHSMADFFNRFYFFSKVVEKDVDLVENIRKSLHKVTQKKEVLEQKTQEIKVLAKVIEEKKVEIVEKELEKKKIYESLKKRLQEYEAQIAELEKSSAELETLILAKTGKSGKSFGSGIMVWPLRGRITSNYGYRRHPMWGGRNFHTGVDVANKYGTPIMAADSGNVIFSGWWDGYGKAIVIDHGKQTTTVYGHMSRIYKQVGASVAKGQIIGLVGSTGYSTGPHLHFEVRKKGKPVNPMPFLN